ncbi:MAG: Hsp70 family protein [Desulfobacterales bacterium]
MDILERPYIIGIDLGTTNSAVAYVDLAIDTADRPPITSFRIPQLTGPGEFVPLPVLPSFLYIPGEYDLDPGSIRHPWPTREDHFAGEFAREQGARVPARLVASAKSWICHGNVDRNARILPWGSADEVKKVSPVEATAAYLSHMRQAWNAGLGDREEGFLEDQTVVLTVPASFDEVARELTLSAARMAGYRRVTLLEEPLAAFYSWLVRHEDEWSRHVDPGELILICDVGGGTTDFTLVTLKAAEGGSPRFERIAVGDHLILGGDNVDLALARQVEAGLGRGRQTLSTDRWKALCHQCRQAKERILGGVTDRHKITLMGEGSRLISGTLAADLDRATLERTVLDGFFPILDAESVDAGPKRQAITEFGLPYEPEPAVTRHLCRFLERHREDVSAALGRSDPVPDLILFNGGSLKPAVIRDRIRSAVRHWFEVADERLPRELDNPDPDLAVSLGAAYYGRVKAGRGVRVGSGSPRSYYLRIAKAEEAAGGPARQEAICLVERGLDEGSRIELADRRFEVLANQPVSFDLFSSSYRSGDRSGELVEIDDSLTALPPLQTVIQFGKKGIKTGIPVQIEAEYTELGTLAVWCRSQVSDHRWQLQFQLRAAAAPLDVRQETVVESALLEKAREEVRSAFAGTDVNRLAGVVKSIARIVDLPREDWPLAMIRDLADALLAAPEARKRSASHEARWMNLLGYCLRPGFGDAFDEERVKKAWRVHSEGSAFSRNAQVRSEWWILWRRLAGGLNAGRQRQIGQELSTLLDPKKSKGRVSPQERLEMWMAVANMERLSVQDKIKWGRILLAELLPGKSRPQHFWALSRIGARELFYGPADRVVPPGEVADWIDAVLDRKWNETGPVAGALTQLGRRTGDRTRDLDPSHLERLLDWLDRTGNSDAFRRYLMEVVPMARQEETAIFGESLPSGLVLHA